jgi:hypothetical protein
MADHTWIVENIASFLAGGLDEAERERFEQHTAGCEACADLLREARNLDRRMETLFAGVRPGPALEDQLIRSLRTISPGGHLRFPTFAKVAAGVAAVVLLGLVGSLLNYLIVEGHLVFPGSPGRNRTLASNNLKQLPLALHTSSLGKEDQRSASEGDSKTLEFARNYNPEAFAEKSGEKTHGAMGVDIDGETEKTTQRRDQYGVWGTGNFKSANTPNSSSAPGTDPAKQSDEPESPLLAGVELPKPPAGDGAIAAPGQKAAGGQPFYTYKNYMPAVTPAVTAPIVHPPARALQPGAKEGAQTPQGKSADQPTEYAILEGFKPADSGKDAAPDTGKEKNKAQPDKIPPAPKPEPALPEPAGAHRVIIRSGEIEFEVESFDAAAAAIAKLVGEVKGGFVATVNSEKLANGKVRGSVVVRVPPERLDPLLLDLRKEIGKAGDLKGQRIGSQDITKQYTDLSSRLRAARAMEERLLQIIKTGKGEIKDLLQAEKELGVWRTKIEEFEGELRYYANQVALSTLTITLQEREIRAPSGVVETERVNLGIEVEDVEKAQREALAVVAAAKGRVTRSELKRQGAGEYSADLRFEVAPEAAGALRERLKQLGDVARLDLDRLLQDEGGSGPPQGAPLKRKDVQFCVRLYNLATVAPRDTVHVNLACVDVDTAYQAVLALGRKTAGRVVNSNITRQRSDQSTATINLEVKAAEAEGVLLGIKEAGEVLRLQVTESPDTPTVTRSKRGFHVQLFALGMVEPRETATLKLATRDVPAGYRSLQEAVAKAKGRILKAQLNEQDRQNITAQLDFDVRRSEEASITAAIAAVGDVFARTVARSPDGDNVIDTKVRLNLEFVNAAALKPRETTTLGVEVQNVDRTVAMLAAYVNEAKGRTVDARLVHEQTGRVTAELVFDVPLAAAAELVEKFKETGTVRRQQSARNPQVPESGLATARLHVLLSNTELIVPSDEGLWPQVRKGLATSFVALSWSLTVVIVGLLFVLPWVVVIYAVYRVVLRLRKGPAPATPAA